MTTRNADTRSITRTVRLDEDVQEGLEQLAEQQNLTVNALMNKALRKFVFWDAPLDKFEAVDTPSQLLVKMMEFLSDQNAKELAKTTGAMLARELIQFMFKELSLAAVLKHFELQGVHFVNHHFDQKDEGDSHTIIIRHTMGPKWSIYYEELIRSLFSELNVPIEVERLENQVTGRFKTGRAAAEAAKAPVAMAKTQY
ncbi:hypothetical protein J2P12_03650 [Candidatus Bathyarchaeota archaeon]|nr:hypothetical protein [Candidatus Bathyarchaeota archaeon]